MATLVKFYVEDDNSILAVFPQLKEKDGFNLCYCSVGQHSTCSLPYAKSLRLAVYPEYKMLKQELESIGYTLKILNK